MSSDVKWKFLYVCVTVVVSWSCVVHGNDSVPEIEHQEETFASTVPVIEVPANQSQQLHIDGDPNQSVPPDDGDWDAEEEYLNDLTDFFTNEGEETKENSPEITPSSSLLLEDQNPNATLLPDAGSGNWTVQEDYLRDFRDRFAQGTNDDGDGTNGLHSAASSENITLGCEGEGTYLGEQGYCDQQITCDNFGGTRIGNCSTGGEVMDGICCKPAPRRFFPIPTVDELDLEASVNRTKRQAYRHLLKQPAEAVLKTAEEELDQMNELTSQIVLPSGPIKSVQKTGHSLMAVFLAARRLKKEKKISATEALRALSKTSRGDEILEEVCPQVPRCDPSYPYYKTGGTCNNLHHPLAGRNGGTFVRLIPGDSKGLWEIKKNAYGEPLPHPRVISTTVFQDDGPSHEHWSLWVANFGEWFMQDISGSVEFRAKDGTPLACCTGNSSDIIDPNHKHALACLPLDVSWKDNPYKRYITKCLNKARLALAIDDECHFTRAVHVNMNNAFFDLEHVYGSNEETVKELRKYEGGLLKTICLGFGQCGNSEGYGSQPECDTTNEFPPVVNQDCLKTGSCDYILGNWKRKNQPGLVTLNTILVRYHNTVARRLASINPHWDDEDLFQETRRILIAQYQHIIYKQYLKVIVGKKALQEYGLDPDTKGHTKDYDKHQKPGVPYEAAFTAFKFGHFLSKKKLRLVDRLGYDTSVEKGENVDLTSGYGSTCDQCCNENFVRHLSVGLLQQKANQIGPYVDSGVGIENTIHHKLFKSEGDEYGFDLHAMDVNRGRDVRLPSYAEAIRACNILPRKVKSWEDFEELIPKEFLRSFGKLYGTIADLELVVAVFLERHDPGANMGPTLLCLLLESFRRMKVTDRFWHTEIRQPKPFTEDQLKAIQEQTSLSSIICQAFPGLKKIVPNAFLVPLDGKYGKNNQITSCDDYHKIPKLNLELWQEPRPKKLTGGVCTIKHEGGKPIFGTCLPKALCGYTNQNRQNLHNECGSTKLSCCEGAAGVLRAHIGHKELTNSERKKFYSITRLAVQDATAKVEIGPISLRTVVEQTGGEHRGLPGNWRYIFTEAFFANEDERNIALGAIALQAALKNIYKGMFETSPGLSVRALYGEKWKDASSAAFLPNTICEYDQRYRTTDGLCNRRKHPQACRSSMSLSFSFPVVNYMDGVNSYLMGKDGLFLPNPRTISLEVFVAKSGGSKSHPLLLPYFVHFLLANVYQPAVFEGSSLFDCCDAQGKLIRDAHNAMPTGCVPVIVPSSAKKPDPFFSDHGIECIPLLRNIPGGAIEATVQPHSPMNRSPGYLQLSAVYGTNVENEITIKKDFGGLVKLRHPVTGTLPILEKSPARRGMYGKACGKTVLCYLVAAPIANSFSDFPPWVTLFLREHNRLAKLLAKYNPLWTNKETFNEAKAINIAQFQVIVFTELLPAIIGHKNVEYYKLRLEDVADNVEATSDLDGVGCVTAAVEKVLEAIFLNMVKPLTTPYAGDKYGRGDNLDRSRIFLLGPDLAADSTRIDLFFQQLLMKYAEEFDEKIFPESVGAHKFSDDIGETVILGYDLLAEAIQSCRVDGMAFYNDLRVACGFPKAHTFADLGDLINDEKRLEKLEKVYKHPDNVDGLVGIMLEKPRGKGSILGGVGVCLMAKMARDWMVKDRYFFNHPRNPRGFTKKQIQTLTRRTLAGVLCDNTEWIDAYTQGRFKRFPKNAFRWASESHGNPILHCDDIAKLNLKTWDYIERVQAKKKGYSDADGIPEEPEYKKEDYPLLYHKEKADSYYEKKKHSKEYKEYQPDLEYLEKLHSSEYPEESDTLFKKLYSKGDYNRTPIHKKKKMNSGENYDEYEDMYEKKLHPEKHHKQVSGYSDTSHSFEYSKIPDSHYTKNVYSNEYVGKKTSSEKHHRRKKVQGKDKNQKTHQYSSKEPSSEYNFKEDSHYKKPVNSNLDYDGEKPNQPRKKLYSKEIYEDHSEERIHSSKKYPKKPYKGKTHSEEHLEKELLNLRRLQSNEYHQRVNKDPLHPSKKPLKKKDPSKIGHSKDHHKDHGKKYMRYEDSQEQKIPLPMKKMKSGEHEKKKNKKPSQANQDLYEKHPHKHSDSTEYQTSDGRKKKPSKDPYKKKGVKAEHSQPDQEEQSKEYLHSSEDLHKKKDIYDVKKVNPKKYHGSQSKESSGPYKKKGSKETERVPSKTYDRQHSRKNLYPGDSYENEETQKMKKVKLSHEIFDNDNSHHSGKYPGKKKGSKETEKVPSKGYNRQGSKKNHSKESPKRIGNTHRGEVYSWEYDKENSSPDTKAKHPHRKMDKHHKDKKHSREYPKSHEKHKFHPKDSYSRKSPSKKYPKHKAGKNVYSKNSAEKTGKPFKKEHSKEYHRKTVKGSNQEKAKKQPKKYHHPKDHHEEDSWEKMPYEYSEEKSLHKKKKAHANDYSANHHKKKVHSDEKGRQHKKKLGSKEYQKEHTKLNTHSRYSDEKDSPVHSKQGKQNKEHTKEFYKDSSEENLNHYPTKVQSKEYEKHGKKNKHPKYPEEKKDTQHRTEGHPEDYYTEGYPAGGSGKKKNEKIPHSKDSGSSNGSSHKRVKSGEYDKVHSRKKPKVPYTEKGKQHAMSGHSKERDHSTGYEHSKHSQGKGKVQRKKDQSKDYSKEHRKHGARYEGFEKKNQPKHKTEDHSKESPHMKKNSNEGHFKYSNKKNKPSKEKHSAEYLNKHGGENTKGYHKEKKTHHSEEGYSEEDHEKKQTKKAHTPGKEKSKNKFKDSGEGKAQYSKEGHSKEYHGEKKNKKVHTPGKEKSKNKFKDSGEGKAQYSKEGHSKEYHGEKKNKKVHTPGKEKSKNKFKDSGEGKTQYSKEVHSKEYHGEKQNKKVHTPGKEKSKNKFKDSGEGKTQYSKEVHSKEYHGEKQNKKVHTPGKEKSKNKFKDSGEGKTQYSKEVHSKEYHGEKQNKKVHTPGKEKSKNKFKDSGEGKAQYSKEVHSKEYHKEHSTKKEHSKYSPENVTPEMKKGVKGYSKKYGKDDYSKEVHPKKSQEQKTIPHKEKDHSWEYDRQEYHKESPSKYSKEENEKGHKKVHSGEYSQENKRKKTKGSHVNKDEKQPTKYLSSKEYSKGHSMKKEQSKYSGEKGTLHRKTGHSDEYSKEDYSKESQSTKSMKNKKKVHQKESGRRNNYKESQSKYSKEKSEKPYKKVSSGESAHENNKKKPKVPHTEKGNLHTKEVDSKKHHKEKSKKKEHSKYSQESSAPQRKKGHSDGYTKDHYSKEDYSKESETKKGKMQNKNKDHSEEYERQRNYKESQVKYSQEKDEKPHKAGNSAEYDQKNSRTKAKGSGIKKGKQRTKEGDAKDYHKEDSTKNKHSKYPQEKGTPQRKKGHSDEYNKDDYSKEDYSKESQNKKNLHHKKKDHSEEYERQKNYKESQFKYSQEKDAKPHKEGNSGEYDQKNSRTKTKGSGINKGKQQIKDLGSKEYDRVKNKNSKYAKGNITPQRKKGNSGVYSENDYSKEEHSKESQGEKSMKHKVKDHSVGYDKQQKSEESQYDHSQEKNEKPYKKLYSEEYTQTNSRKKIKGSHMDKGKQGNKEVDAKEYRKEPNVKNEHSKYPQENVKPQKKKGHSDDYNKDHYNNEDYYQEKNNGHADSQHFDEKNGSPMKSEHSGGYQTEQRIISSKGSQQGRKEGEEGKQYPKDVNSKNREGHKGIADRKDEHSKDYGKEEHKEEGKSESNSKNDGSLVNNSHGSVDQANQSQHRGSGSHDKKVSHGSNGQMTHTKGQTKEAGTGKKKGKHQLLKGRSELDFDDDDDDDMEDLNELQSPEDSLGDTTGISDPGGLLQPSPGNPAVSDIQPAVTNTNANGNGQADTIGSELSQQEEEPLLPQARIFTVDLDNSTSAITSVVSPEASFIQESYHDEATTVGFRFFSETATLQVSSTATAFVPEGITITTAPISDNVIDSASLSSLIDPTRATRSSSIEVQTSRSGLADSEEEYNILIFTEDFDV